MCLLEPWANLPTNVEVAPDARQPQIISFETELFPTLFLIIEAIHYI